jgi:hypothetical protein
MDPSRRHLRQLEINKGHPAVERGLQLVGLRRSEVALRLQHEKRRGEAHGEAGILGLKPQGSQFPGHGGDLRLEVRLHLAARRVSSQG